MGNVTFTTLTDELAAGIENWLQPEAAETLLKQRQTHTFGDTFGATTDSWVALLDGTPVAIGAVHTDTTRTGYLDFYVRPSERRHGIGAELVSYILDQPPVRSLSRLEALVEPDNTAAQKILNHKGFSQVGYADDNRIRFERH